MLSSRLVVLRVRITLAFELRVELHARVAFPSRDTKETSASGRDDGRPRETHGSQFTAALGSQIPPRENSRRRSRRRRP